MLGKRKKKIRKAEPAVSTGGNQPSREIFFVPTYREWAGAYAKFREGLSRKYRDEPDKWVNDTAFCRDNGISRAQFSRAIRGAEKPSQKIIEALNEALPEIYKTWVEQWTN